MDVPQDYYIPSYIREPLPRRNSFRLKCPITVEPLLFLIFFAISCTDSVVTNLLEERTCIRDLNLTSEVCMKPLTPEMEKLVQPYTTKIIMSRSVIEALIPAMLSFFIGPWSDVNGRKTFLVSSFSGYLLCYLTWGALTFFSDFSPYLFLLTTIPIAFSGGLVAIFTCSFCYISDVTNNNNRAFRMAVLECCLVLGILLGYFTSSMIFQRAGRYGYFAVFSSAGGACFVALIYILFFLPETINTNQFQDNRAPLFNTLHLRDMFTVLFSKRPRYGRAQILILSSVCGLVIMIVQGEPSVKFLSLREVFSWTAKQYNYYSAACSLIAVVATMAGMWLFSIVAKLPGIFITLIAALLGTGSGVLMAVSTTGLDFFLSSNLSCLGPLIGPLLRSELSKIVPQRDLGKVYAFMSSLEAISPLIGAPSYTQLYDYVLSSMPLAVYFLTSAVWLFVTILVLIVVAMKLKYENWSQTKIDDEEEPLESGVEGP